LRQDEHLVRLGAPEVRRVIEVRIAEPGVHAIAVVERTFEVGHGPQFLSDIPRLTTKF
jgi:hypothetical protein